MDGTGELFGPFVQELPKGIGVKVVSYPVDQVLQWENYVDLVMAKLPKDEPFAIVAESFSGPIAVEVASRGLSNLRGLILCCSFLKSPLPFSMKWLGRVAPPSLFRNAPSEFIIRRYFVGKDAEPDLVEAVRTEVASVSSNVLASRLRLISRVDVREQFERVAVPFLYLAALNDRLVGQRGAGQVMACSTDSRLSTIAGPHLLLQKNPKECREAILDFLNPGEKLPEFPLKVIWRGGEEEVYENEWDLLQNLEHYDSNSTEFSEESYVLDSKNRPVLLKVSLPSGECVADLCLDLADPDSNNVGR